MQKKKLIVSLILLLTCITNILVMPVFADSTFEIIGECKDKLYLTSNNQYIFQKTNVLPGEEWEAQIAVKNTSAKDIEFTLHEICNNSSDNSIFNNMYLKLYNKDIELYNGSYNVSKNTIIPSIVVSPGTTEIIIAKVGINSKADNRIQGKNLNATWVFEGTTEEPQKHSDLIICDNYTLVTVTDMYGNIIKSFKTVNENAVTIRLPDNYNLSLNTLYNITITDKLGIPKPYFKVILTDKNGNSQSGLTNSDGGVMLPVSSSPDINDSYVYSVYCKNSDGDIIGKYIHNDTKGLLLLKAPEIDGYKPYFKYKLFFLNSENRTVTFSYYKLSNSPESMTYVEHKAYIKGYYDAEFKPDNYMTRSEAAAIFARLISFQKNETIKGNTSFSDVSKDSWYYTYVAYLKKYKIIEGYNDNTFRPDNNISRSEFVTMAVRYYSLFNDIIYPLNTSAYKDTYLDSWAIKDISYATAFKWINGYEDGTFRGDNPITRAEVVTIINRETNRKVDETYINTYPMNLKQFRDLNKSYWAFYDIIEASNDHMVMYDAEKEYWKDF